MSEPKTNDSERSKMLKARQAAAQTTRLAHRASFPDRQPAGKGSQGASQSRSPGQVSLRGTARKLPGKGAER